MWKIFKKLSKAKQLCECKNCHTKELGFWEKVALKDGRHTMFTLYKCLDCRGVLGFPQFNFNLALSNGTDDTKEILNKIIKTKQCSNL